MNLHSIKLVVLFCGFAAYNRPVLGQGTGNQQVIENTVAAYQKAIGPHSQLYRGAIYEFYDMYSTSGPLFNDSFQFQNGNVKYFGVAYKNIPLLYDLNYQQVITLSYNKIQKFLLLNEGISEFDIYGHHFIRLVPDELNKKMDAGFYDELYNNKTQLLVKRSKTGQFESITAKRVYNLQTTYYLKKDSIYHTFKTKGQLLNLLGDKKKELNKYIKDNHIDFADNKEKAMVALLAYYDSITN
jgi:hypothetical protein